MPRLALSLLIVATALITGCAGYDVGQSQFAPTRSHDGTTLNSPVADQNPHSGGDSSYPSSADDGKVPSSPEYTYQ